MQFRQRGSHRLGEIVGLIKRLQRVVFCNLGSVNGANAVECIEGKVVVLSFKSTTFEVIEVKEV
jgi:hypothetical protein